MSSLLLFMLLQLLFANELLCQYLKTQNRGVTGREWITIWSGRGVMRLWSNLGHYAVFTEGTHENHENPQLWWADVPSVIPTGFPPVKVRYVMNILFYNVVNAQPIWCYIYILFYSYLVKVKEVKVFPLHALKAYRKSKYTGLFVLNLDVRWRSASRSGQFSSRKDPRHPLNRKLGRRRSPAWSLPVICHIPTSTLSAAATTNATTFTTTTATTLPTSIQVL